jgi:prepilin peptidase CpaA
MVVPIVTATAAMAMFSFTMVHAGITDLTSYKIRNDLMLAFLLVYAALAPFSGFAAHEILWSVAIAAAVLLCGFVLFARGWIGGGDAKLAALTALWFGADQTPAYLLYTALFGGVFTLAVVKFRERPLPASLLNRPWVARLHSRDAGIPYGVAMAMAGLVVFPQTHWMARGL